MSQRKLDMEVESFACGDLRRSADAGCFLHGHQGGTMGIGRNIFAWIFLLVVERGDVFLHEYKSLKFIRKATNLS